MENINGLAGYPLAQSINNFQSKAEALKYAIEFTETLNISGPNIPNYNAAQELFDFICKNVALPDVRPNPADGLVEFAKEYIEKLAKEKGFSGRSSYVYNNDKILLGVKGVVNWHKVEFVAPTQSLLQRWLRDNGFGEVEVRHWPETCKYPHHYGWEVKDNLGDLMSYSSKMFDTYELALEDALKYALENLV